MGASNIDLKYGSDKIHMKKKTSKKYRKGCEFMFTLSENFYLMSRDTNEPEWMRSERFDFCDKGIHESLVKRFEQLVKRFAILFA